MNTVSDIYNANPKRTALTPKIKRQFHARFNKQNPTQDTVIQPEDTREFWMLVQVNDDLHLIQSKHKGAK